MHRLYLAGGCFWGVQAALDLLLGITKTSTGYCGGHLNNPSYEEVCTKTSGHTEAVLVEYEPEQISINEILDLFFQSMTHTKRMAKVMILDLNIDQEFIGTEEMR